VEVTLATPHAELVFHVLAHVPGARFSASLYDPAYVAWAEAHLGPASTRPLGEDLAVLAQGQNQGVAIRDQRYARVFVEPEAARAWTTTQLESLPEDALDRVDQRDAMLPSDPRLEVLRCAVALELEPWRRLPPPSLPVDLATELASWVALAPRLEVLPLRALRSLGARGRLWNDAIWIGIPDDVRTSREEVGWQAAHEATLAEVSEVVAGDDAAERLSVALLAARVSTRAPTRTESHRHWVARYGGVPSLSTAEHARLDELRSGT